MGASVSANLPKSPILSTQSATEHDGTEPISSILISAVMVAALLSTGCSNFNSRHRYWNEQLAGKLKAAPLYRLKSFAASNQHEIHCNGDGISREGAPDLSECYLVDAKSKGAMLNYRGKLFVVMKMTDGRVESHTFTTTVVLY